MSKSLDPFSAGTDPKPIDPRAITVMREVGVDISTHKSKSLAQLGAKIFDLVITVCDRAAKTCPTVPARTRIIHVPFEDPPALAVNSKDEAEALAHYRKVRDEIRKFVLTLPSLLE